MTPRQHIAALALAALLGACAYTGGGETGTGAAPTETTTTGVITGFGSIFVGGVEYFTDNATIDLDGEMGDETRLAVGMIVTVSGTVAPDGQTGQARQVAYRKNLKGPVQASTIPAGGDSGTLTVLGQSVTVDVYTVYDGSDARPTIDTLQSGDLVEVSGFPTDGGIYATRIAHQSGPSEAMELKGRVSALDPVQRTFRIGTLTIDYSGLTDPGLADGRAVEVKGTLQNDRLLASELDLEDHLPGELRPMPGREGELEGIVTAIDLQAGTLTVNGQTLSVPMPLLQQVQTGDRVELEGRFDAQGNFQVHDWQMRPRRGQLAELTAPVEAVDRQTRRVTLLGARYQLTNATLLKDDYRDVREFGLDDLDAGQDWLELRVYQTDDGWRIERLERTEPQDEYEIEGVVEALDGNTLHIAGLQITLSGATLPSVGMRVELSGSGDPIQWTWQEASDSGKPHGHDSGMDDDHDGNGPNDENDSEEAGSEDDGSDEIDETHGGGETDDPNDDPAGNHNGTRGNGPGGGPHLDGGPDDPEGDD